MGVIKCPACGGKCSLQPKPVGKPQTAICRRCKKEVVIATAKK